MGDRPAHPQVWARVNAHVDEGVADLISALSRFKGLRTLESCQGEPDGAAWACFVVGANVGWRPLADLVLGYLGPALASDLGDMVDLSIHATEAGGAQGENSRCARKR